MVNFKKMALVFVLTLPLFYLASCVTPEEPVNEHYVAPTGETAPGNTVDSKQVLQAQPATKPESQDDAVAPNVTVTNKCTDSVSGKEYNDRDVGYQECIARSLQDAKTENEKK